MDIVDYSIAAKAMGKIKKLGIALLTKVGLSTDKQSIIIPASIDDNVSVVGHTNDILLRYSITAGALVMYKNGVWVGITSEASAVIDAVLRNEVGATNGVASLDNTGNIPSTQLPFATPTTSGAVKIRRNGTTAYISTTATNP